MRCQNGYVQQPPKSGNCVKKTQKISSKTSSKTSSKQEQIVLCWADGSIIKAYNSKEEAAKDNNMTVEKVDYFTKKRGNGPVLSFSGKYFLIKKVASSNGKTSKRCKNGTHKNKKTGKCEKNE